MRESGRGQLRSCAAAALLLVATAPARASAQSADEPPAAEEGPDGPETPGEGAPEDEGEGDAPPAESETSEEDGVEPDSPDGDELGDLRARVEEMELEILDLRDTVSLLEEDLQFAEQQAQSQSKNRLVLHGYVDVGAAWAQGNGSGIRSDLGHRVFPEYTGEVPDSWVFMGDPLSTAINARGDPADTGESRAIAFDSADSGGAFTFLVNTVSLSVIGSLAEDLTLNAMIDFVPRRRDISVAGDRAFGDYIDVQLAYLEHVLHGSDFDLTLTAGKLDSVLGVEYRTQDAPDRVEVTPSLLCRYTCGRPIGLKGRLRLLDDRALVVNLAATNGGHFREYFPFNADVDVNDMVTGAVRLSYTLPIGPGIEVGVSGALGAQDMQPANDLLQWHVGADVLVDWDDLVFSAEFMQGKAPGDAERGGAACSLAPCLEYRGAYGRVGYRFLPWFLPYLRVDWRDALHRDGASFVYVSELIRVTGGIRFEIGPHVVLKAEYTRNVELSPIPQFPNDVAAASLIGRL